MAATGYIIRGIRGDAIAVARSRQAAEARASRFDGSVEEHVYDDGERVSFTFHGHPRTGRVVGGQGATVVVEFSQGSTGVVRKSINVEKLNPPGAAPKSPGGGLRW